MRKIVVQKFGGSSLSTLEKIKTVSRKIISTREKGYDVVAVVSAMGSTTNELVDMAKSLSENPRKREMDMLFSTGERITMSLMCISLNENNVSAISLTGSQAGIITNANHNDARVIEVRPFRILDELAEGNVVVVGGFQGVSYKRDITTLGRGGSDTSAVALAAALDAEWCEIYSDVDGVYSADPKIIENSEHIEELSYQHMQEMSNSGAKVLNAQAVEFAKNNNIAIYARSSFGSKNETVIRKLPKGNKIGIKSVVYENDLVKIKCGQNFFKLIEFLDNEGVQSKEQIFDTTGNRKEGSCLVSKNNIHDYEIFQMNVKKHFEDVEILEDLGSVSIIGDGLNNNSIINESVKLLDLNGIILKGLTTTSFRISMLLNTKNVQECLKICHKKWIEEA